MTTILIKKKDTAGAPAAGDLTNAAGGTEIAVNTATKRIYTKDAAGNVVELGTNPSVITNNLLFSPDNTYDIGASGASRPRTVYVGTSVISPAITDSGLTSGRVTYAGTGGLLSDSANFTYTGTNLVVSNGRLILRTLSTDSDGLNVYQTTSDRSYITNYFDGTMYLGVNNTYQLSMTKSQVATNLVDFYAYGVRVGRGGAEISTNTVVGYNSLDNALMTGGYNLVAGYISGRSITSGNENVAIGSTVLTTLTTGVRNTAVGNNALQYNVSGDYNTAVGMSAAASLLGSQNVVVGYDALSPASAISVSGNVAVGYQANKNNGGYGDQTAIGHQALLAGGGGSEVAVGFRALYSETSSGGVNTAVGYEAMNAVTGAARNVAVGYRALYGSGATPTPGDSVAVGNSALSSVSTGFYNVAVGGSALALNTTASANTAVGYQASYSNLTGTNLTVMGYQAGLNLLGSYNDAFGYLALRGAAGSTASENTAIGRLAMFTATSAAYNVAVGSSALGSITSGTSNTSVGWNSGLNLTTATRVTSVGYYAAKGGAGSAPSYSVAVGAYALAGVTSGDSNVAIGDNALAVTTTGAANTAVGASAGYSQIGSTGNTLVGAQANFLNTAGTFCDVFGKDAAYNNTANGISAFGRAVLYNNSTGTENAAFGTSYAVYAALRFNSTGSYNSAFGPGALANNTTANGNVGMGYQAGYSNQVGSYNTFIGHQAGYNTTGSPNGRNVFVGEQAGYTNTSGRWNTYIGHYAGQAMTTGQSNTIVGRYDGNMNGLDLRSSSNNIVLADGDGYQQYYIRYGGDSSTAAYRVRSPYHSYGHLYTSGTIASGGSIAQNVNGTGNDGSIGIMGVITRWTSVDGGDSTALYAIGHGNSYNTYTLLQKSEVNSITINESSGTVTISNGSANQISYEFVYLNYGTGEITRLQY